MQKYCRLSCGLCHNAAFNHTVLALQVLFPAGYPDCRENITSHRAWFYYISRQFTDPQLMPLEYVMGVVGFVLVTVFLTVTVKAMLVLQGSRKFYTVLLNRVIGDLLLTVLIPLSHLLNGGKRRAVGGGSPWIQLLTVMSLWGMMTSYVSLSLLKLYGVAKPLRLREVVTQRRCVHIAVTCWASFALLGKCYWIIYSSISYDCTG